MQNAASAGSETPADGQANGTLLSVAEQSSAEVMEQTVLQQ